ncbi:hypothetical protein [Poriferisphaera sp. WC338]|uniref:hypothetical protein n=1 Tax=Poriferisphaera sp. WC338 TaxID=3425129 RepID=UPI003D8180BD
MATKHTQPAQTRICKRMIYKLTLILLIPLLFSCKHTKPIPSILEKTSQSNQTAHPKNRNDYLEQPHIDLPIRFKDFSFYLDGGSFEFIAVDANRIRYEFKLNNPTEEVIFNDKTANCHLYVKGLWLGSTELTYIPLNSPESAAVLQFITHAWNQTRTSNKRLKTLFQKYQERDKEYAKWSFYVYTIEQGVKDDEILGWDCLFEIRDLIVNQKLN